MVKLSNTIMVDRDDERKRPRIIKKQAHSYHIFLSNQNV